MAEVKEKKQSDYWEETGMVFVTGGLRWGVAPNGATVCIGPVASVLDNREPVTKLSIKGNIPLDDESNVKSAILLHEEKRRGPGRPRKEPGEPVCRMTTWRRKQEEKQLELVF